MEKENFERMLRQPGLMDRKDFFELESLLMEKPWFTAGHALLAKAAKNIGHSGFDRLEIRANAYVANSAGLGQFIHENVRLYTMPLVVETPLIIAEPEKSSASIEEFLGSTPEVMEAEAEIVMQEELASDAIAETETLLGTIHDKNTEAEPAPKASVTDNSNVKLNGFFAWLNAIKTQSFLPHKSKSAGDDAPTPLHSGPKPAADEHTQAIIEKFISTNPTISRGSRKMYNAAEYAKTSEEDHQEIISETLAKVYSQQKLFSKAIEVYEKLSLIHPDKKDIFAARVKALKEEIN